MGDNLIESQKAVQSDIITPSAHVNQHFNAILTFQLAFLLFGVGGGNLGLCGD